MSSPVVTKIAVRGGTIDGGGKLNDDELKVTNFQDLASYNWLDRSEPSILVPGVPPLWSPPRLTPHLKPDSGARYVDQNTDRYPWSPIEPLVRAVMEMHPEFDLGSLDIVSDRRPIRKLIGAIKQDGDDFRFGMEIIGTTAVLTRMEKQTRDQIPSGQFQGFRLAFEEAYTKLLPIARGSTSHHRVVSYSFGGFRFLIRSAVDAYIETAAGTPEVSAMSGNNREELATYMKAASLGSAAPSVADRAERPGLVVVSGGHTVSHDRLAEMKTRFKFSKTPFNSEAQLPDLWLSQTPHVIHAEHQNVGTKWSRAKSGQPRLGEFVDIDVKCMRDHLNEWEKQNVSTLRTLTHVLRQLVDHVKTAKSPCIVHFQGGQDHLKISMATRDQVPTLPEDVQNLLLHAHRNAHDESLIKS